MPPDVEEKYWWLLTSSGEKAKAAMLGECIDELSKPSGASIARGSSPNDWIWLIRPKDSKEYTSGSGSLGMTMLVTGGTCGEKSAGRFRP